MQARSRIIAAGAIVVNQPSLDRSTIEWPGQSLRRFMTWVLLHELGHHVLQHHTGKRRVCIARRADHEAHACLLATRWLTMLGSFA
jgi:hypothetical protein